MSQICSLRFSGKTRRYTVETILEELNIITEEGRIDKNEAPKPKLLTAYAAYLKRKRVVISQYSN